MTRENIYRRDKNVTRNNKVPKIRVFGTPKNLPRVVAKSQEILLPQLRHLFFIIAWGGGGGNIFVASCCLATIFDKLGTPKFWNPLHYRKLMRAGRRYIFRMLANIIINENIFCRDTKILSFCNKFDCAF